jgi:(p)ppGpp synthase/HD superfamily hydrolase
MATVVDDTSAPSFLRALPLALAAFSFARRAHAEQRRESDAARFITHPLEVASLLHNTGCQGRSKTRPLAPVEN